MCAKYCVCNEQMHLLFSHLLHVVQRLCNIVNKPIIDVNEKKPKCDLWRLTRIRFLMNGKRKQNEINISMLAVFSFVFSHGSNWKWKDSIVEAHWFSSMYLKLKKPFGLWMQRIKNENKSLNVIWWKIIKENVLFS